MLSRFSWSARRGAFVLTTIIGVAIGSLVFGLLPSFAQEPVPPAPPSTGADVKQSYFGPPPSESFSDGAKFLVGPQQLLKSGTISADAASITLPLYKGQLRNGKNVWYILTDTTDQENANSLGLNFSAKLAYSAVGRAVRAGTLEKDTSVTFAKGGVDFRPERRLVAGDSPNLFPPKVAQPGSVGDADYTPLVRIGNLPGTPVYNAPVVAFDVSADQLNFCNGNPDYSRVHDRVMKICPSAESNGTGTVTIEITPIFSFGKPAAYMSTEASDAVVATLDKGTLTPAMKDIQTGRDDSAFSAVERLFVTVNGPMGKDNPQRQGLNSAIAGEGAPLQVVGGIPNVANDYSPLWDINLGVWTKTAVDRGYRARVSDEFQILGLVRDGWITGPDGAKYGSVGILVNCPIVMRFL